MEQKSTKVTKEETELGRQSAHYWIAPEQRTEAQATDPDIATMRGVILALLPIPLRCHRYLLFKFLI